jgi:hypothetical protein
VRKDPCALGYMIALSAEGLSAFQVCREGREGIHPLGQEQRPHCPGLRQHNPYCASRRSCTWSVVCRLVMVAGEGETTTVPFSTTERQPHPQQPSRGDAKHPREAEKINQWMTEPTRRA